MPVRVYPYLSLFAKGNTKISCGLYENLLTIYYIFIIYSRNVTTPSHEKPRTKSDRSRPHTEAPRSSEEISHPLQAQRMTEDGLRSREILYYRTISALTIPRKDERRVNTWLWEELTIRLVLHPRSTCHRPRELYAKDILSRVKKGILECWSVWILIYNLILKLC